MQRTCIKCGHTNMAASGSSDAACPQCGVIYAKAVAAQARPAARTGSSSGFGATSGFSAGRSSRHGADNRASQLDDMQRASRADFVIRLRAESLYPTVRTLTRWGFGFMCIIALLTVVGGFMARGAGPFALIAAIGVACVVLLVGLVFRETTLMLADLSDASVRLAAAAERKGSDGAG